MRCMTRIMNPRMRMSFESIRPAVNPQGDTGQASSHPPPPHTSSHPPPPQISSHPPPPQPSQEEDPISPSTILLFSRSTGMRPRSTESSSSKMWRPSELTCAQSWPTRRPSSVISSPYRTSLPRSSPSSSHRHRHRSDPADHQGSFLHPLSFFHTHWG